MLNASAFKAVLQASLTAFTSPCSTASSILLGAIKSPSNASSSASVAAPPQQASPPNLGLSVLCEGFAPARREAAARGDRLRCVLCHRCGCGFCWVQSIFRRWRAKGEKQSIDAGPPQRIVA